jgi:ankyrin repeat protein
MFAAKPKPAHEESRHLSGFIQPKDKNALNNFLEANNTPFSPKKHGCDNDFDFEKIVDKPTTTKFEEYMRYMKLRKWESLHLAAQRDWSMEVITERERQCSKIALTSRAGPMEQLNTPSARTDRFVSSPGLNSGKRSRIEFFRNLDKDKLAERQKYIEQGFQVGQSIGGFVTEGNVCKQIRGTGQDVTELVGWTQNSFKKILDNKDQINMRDKHKRAALHIASEKDNYRFVKNLLSSNHIQLDITDQKGWTPLHYATAMGNTRTVTALCLKKANTNVMTPNDGATPIHYAASQGYTHILRILYLFGGADINAVTKQGRNCLHLAARTSDSVKILHQILEIAKEMNGLKSIQPQKPKKKIVSPLAKQDFALIQKQKLTIDSVDNFGNTVLHYAARAGNLEMCKLLVNEFKCSMKIRNNKGYTPLHISIYKGFFGVAEFLLNASQNYAALAEVLVSLLNSHNRTTYVDVIEYIKKQLDQRMQFVKKEEQ